MILLPPKTPSKNRHKVSENTTHILKWQLEANPSLMVGALREQNSLLLDTVSIRREQATLKRDLVFISYCTLRKPLKHKAREE